MNTTLRRAALRAVAVTAATGALVTGALATSASAVTSQNFSSESSCLNAQRGSAGSFVRISKPCYKTDAVVQVAGGVWVIAKVWRFEYVTRTR